MHNYLFFFFNDTATTEIYTLSLHDALPISRVSLAQALYDQAADLQKEGVGTGIDTLRANVELQNEKQRLIEAETDRSEEHTSELQSPCNLVCRLLLEKKKI